MRIIRQRLDFIDLAKGFGMLMVIYLHVSINYLDNPFTDSWCRRMMGSMFMPIFFILSGLFFSARKPLKEWIEKKSRRLIVPFISFYTLTYILNCTVSGVLKIKTKNEFHYSDIFQVFYRDVFSNNVIWFLLALFWDSVILYFIVKYVSNKYCRILMTLVIGMIGILLGENKVNIPLYVDTAFTAFPFLFLGFLGKEYDVLNKIVGLRTVMKYSLLIGVFVVGFIVDYIFGEVASMVNNSQTGILQFYGCAIAGSLSVIALSMIINRLPLITFLGRNSIVVLCTQMYIINVVVKILKMIDLNYYVSSLLVMLVVCLSYYIVTPIIKKYVPWIIGDIM